MEEKKTTETKNECYCTNCRRTMLDVNFYLSKNKEKFPPDGRLNLCKKCLTMHVNNWEPSTFMNILKDVDVPFIEAEWNALLEKYGKDPKKTSSTAIIGRYLAKMKLKQFRDYTFADTERFREEQAEKDALVRRQEQAQLNQYSAALRNGEAVKNAESLTEEDLENMSDEEIANFFPSAEVMPISLEDQITPDEKKMLSLKWGRLYKLEEWVDLERFYRDMMESYDIQTAAHKDYLKKICKASLKMDQAIDCGDIEGFQKLSKVYDTLMKSAKFTAAQNKAESDDYIDSLCEMVSLCETQGFIPKYDVSIPKDIVDITINDMNKYVERLIKNEMNLGNMIESALMKMKIEEEREEGELDDMDDFINPDMQDVLEDVDFEEFNEFVDDQQEFDIIEQKGGR